MPAEPSEIWPVSAADHYFYIIFNYHLKQARAPEETSPISMPDLFYGATLESFIFHFIQWMTQDSSTALMSLFQYLHMLIGVVFVSTDVINHTRKKIKQTLNPKYWTLAQNTSWVHCATDKMVWLEMLMLLKQAEKLQCFGLNSLNPNWHACHIFIF